MVTDSPLTTVQNILADHDTLIGYHILRNEIDFRMAPFPLRLLQTPILLPQDKATNAFACVQILMDQCKNAKPCVVVPGCRFDIYGTRHGHGGGWYDRFLSKIPRWWLRIGVIDAVSFSTRRIVGLMKETGG